MSTQSNAMTTKMPLTPTLSPRRGGRLRTFNEHLEDSGFATTHAKFRRPKIRAWLPVGGLTGDEIMASTADAGGAASLPPGGSSTRAFAHGRQLAGPALRAGREASF